MCTPYAQRSPRLAALLFAFRAVQELKDCGKDPETSGLSVKLVDESDYMHWKAEIKGPVSTPYEGGKFAVDIVLPSDYPFVPPKVCGTSPALTLALSALALNEASRGAQGPPAQGVRSAQRACHASCAQMKFDTKVWHPNISSESGAICLDILKNEWSPALTVRTALISLQALMSAPEPDDPQDAVVAKQYKENKEEFTKTAKFWTDTYATGPPTTTTAAVHARHFSHSVV